MAIRSRRVVTGLNAEGKSCVLYDDTMDNLPGAGTSPRLVWITETFPASNEGTEDVGLTPVTGDLFSNGSGFLTLGEMQPGQETRMHATDTLDFIIVLHGQIRLSLEDSEVLLGPGDVVIDRGVNHRWSAVGEEPVRLAAVMLPAKPLSGSAATTWDPHLPVSELVRPEGEGIGGS
jgi:quercetin dioxygenase-like cupin family protein